MSTVTVIEGAVAGIIWQAPDNTAVIARLATGVIARGQRVGSGPSVGLTYRFHGTWTRHPKYGEQFSWEGYEVVASGGRKGVVAYLVAYCERVGEVTAGKLYDAYGDDAIRTLREAPERVIADGHLPEPVCIAASQTLHNMRAWEPVRAKLLGILAGRGFQVAPLMRDAIRHWGRRAPERIRRDPFRMMLLGMPSAGFVRCDKLYTDLGHPPNRLKRQLLAAQHYLRGNPTGDTWHKAETVGEEITRLCPGGDPVRTLKYGLRTGLLRKRRADGVTWIAEAGKAANEASVARNLRDLNRMREVARRG